jgi:putative ABC transport system ATP-binding protein
MEIRGVPDARAKARGLLAEVGLTARGHHYPSQLSGGEQQRVAIARAFANAPAILLADEPTGSLDAQNGAHVFDLLLKLNRQHGTTLLLVTHEQSLAEQADRVIRLHEGRIVEDRENQTSSVASTLSSPDSPISPSSHLSAKFIAHTARREMRASWQRLLLFFLSIAIGVGSIVGIRSLIQNMKAELQREVRAMYGGDVRVGNNQAWEPKTKAVLERLAQSPLVIAHTESLETQTMVRPADGFAGRPLMVQLRAVQPSVPLYGAVRLHDGVPYSSALLRRRGVLVQPGLLRQTNLKVGDQLKIGSLVFTIRGVLASLPGNAMQFGPVQRVLMGYKLAAPD